MLTSARRQCVDDRSPLRVLDFDVDNSKAKSALDRVRSIGRPAGRWLTRAGLFDSVNLKNTTQIAMNLLRPGGSFPNNDVIYVPVARMERSAIRDRWCNRQVSPGFHPGYKTSSIRRRHLCTPRHLCGFVMMSDGNDAANSHLWNLWRKGEENPYTFQCPHH